MSAPKLDAAFLDTFAQATLETLRVQCSFTAKSGKAFRKGTGADLPTAVAGIIGITATGFNGSIAIGFPMKTYLSIMSGMLGETYTTLTKDLEDGAGELINIIFGCAKKALNDKGFNISRAIPSVIHGQNLSVLQLAKLPVIVIPFESEGGAFQIEVVLE